MSKNETNTTTVTPTSMFLKAPFGYSDPAKKVPKSAEDALKEADERESEE